MNELKKLQAAYKAGKLTKEQYTAKVKELLEDGEISQEEHDQAQEFDPAGDDDKAIYSQADVDRIVARKATSMVRKALKEAGVEIDADNKTLLSKVAELVKAGEGKNPSELEKEVAQLRKQVAKLPDLEAANKRLTVEAAVLKVANKYNPVNPAQVVRALNADYADLLEYDDESGALKEQSVVKAIKRIAEAEPNLFNKAPGEGNGEGDGDGGEGGQKSSFQGKPPGGTGEGGSKPGDKNQAKVNAALELMGIRKPEQK